MPGAEVSAVIDLQKVWSGDVVHRVMTVDHHMVVGEGIPATAKRRQRIRQQRRAGHKTKILAGKERSETFEDFVTVAGNIVKEFKSVFIAPIL